MNTRRSLPDDPFTMELRLCDDDGIVRGGAMHHGTDYPCTGHAHYAGEHIRCISQAHPDGLPTEVLGLIRDPDIDMNQVAAVAPRPLPEGEDMDPIKMWADAHGMTREQAVERGVTLTEDGLFLVIPPYKWPIDEDQDYREASVAAVRYPTIANWIAGGNVHDAAALSVELGAALAHTAGPILDSARATAGGATMVALSDVLDALYTGDYPGDRHIPGDFIKRKFGGG